MEMVNDHIIKDLIDGVKASNAIIHSMSDEVRNTSIAIAQIKAELASSADKIAKLSRVVTEGNGQRPLTTRVAILEENIDDIKTDLEKATKSIKDKLDSLEGQLNTQKTAGVSGRWSLAAALVAGIVSIVGVLITTVGPSLIKPSTNNPPLPPSIEKRN